MNNAEAGSTVERRWAMAIRVLGLLSAVLLIIAVLEARTIRLARAELQQLRDGARDRSAAAVVPPGELRKAVRWLDTYYADPAGLGVAGGLCPSGRLDDEAIATFVGGAFLPARAAGRPFEDAVAVMKAAVLASGAGSAEGRRALPGAGQ